MTNDDPQSVDWAALAERVRERRVALGLRQSDLEALGGPSNGTVRNIEQAARTKYSARTLAQLEAALQWPRGTANRILDGLPVEEEAPGEDWSGTSEPDWAALGKLIKTRREALRLPQDLVTHGGPSEFTIRRLERGEAPGIRPKTKTQLERVLQLRPGLVDDVLAGRDVSEDLDEESAADGAPVCACVVGSPAWIERELATERRINAIAQVFQGEMQRLLALVEAAGKPKE